MKISVIMASNCTYDPNRQNRDKKLVRAVNSFLKQTHEDKELIIVSDGCEITNRLYEENWKTNKQIKFFSSQKLPVYNGGIRTIGLKLADGDIISYLDNDDVLGRQSLEIIAEQFTDEVDFVYYDDYLVLTKDFSRMEKRHVELRWAQAGTSSISHKNFLKKGIDLDWSKCSGYGHDYMFILGMIAEGLKFKKLKKTPQYYVCHYSGFDG
jgi:cellulose synthase/poly-beta-1,6-N-acetylglucosamine synthase-like glycosyltransferase